jgi:hypothetical protein
MSSTRPYRPLPRLAAAGLVAAVALVAGGAGPAPRHSEVPDIAHRQRGERTRFTDAEIVDGFFRVAFGAEYHLAGRVDRIRKYEKAVRVFIEPGPRADRKAQMAAVVADIAARIQHLDLHTVDRRDDANIVVSLVRDRDLYHTLSSLYGSEKATDIRRSLDPQCLSGFRKDEDFAIIASDVILAVDAGDFVFFDCAYEEMLQSLGPINDTNAVPWTMFNDNVQMGYFDRYDQYLMNILYHPQIRAGMTVDEVRAVMPGVLAEVRRFVERSARPGQ